MIQPYPKFRKLVTIFTTVVDDVFLNVFGVKHTLTRGGPDVHSKILGSVLGNIWFSHTGKFLKVADFSQDRGRRTFSNTPSILMSKQISSTNDNGTNSIHSSLYSFSEPIDTDLRYKRFAPPSFKQVSESLSNFDKVHLLL